MNKTMVLCSKCGTPMEYELLLSKPAQHKFTCPGCKYTSIIHEQSKQIVKPLEEILHEVVVDFFEKRKEKTDE